MFICQDCHPTCPVCLSRPDPFHDSYGRCELCGQVKGCEDCHHDCPGSAA